MHGNNDTNIQTNIHGGSSSVVNLDYPVAAHTAASWAWSLLLLYGHGVLSVPKYLYQLGILNIHLHPAKYTNLPLPTFQLGQVDSGRGSPPKEIHIFWTRPTNFRLTDFKKTIALAFLKAT